MRKMTETQKFHRLLKKMYRQGSKPAEHPSLMDCERYHCEEDSYEYFIEYGFLPEKWYGKNMNEFSDESLDEWVKENMWERVCSPYDCSGQRFTRWIKWHRNPCGRISFVHYLGIDV